VRIAPTDTTPLSDENAPEPARPSPKAKKTPAPKSSGAPRRDPVRRSPQGSNAGSEKKGQARPQQRPPAKVNATATSAPRAPATPKPVRAPEPGWTPDPIRSPKPAADLDRAADAPPRIPNWERARASTSQPDTRWEDMQWEDADESADTELPVHAAPLTRRRRLRQSRAFVITLVVVGVVAAFVAGAAIVSSLHNPTAATPPTRTSSTHPVSPSGSGTSRLLAATEAAETATTQVRSTLDTLSGFPTPTNVAPIVNPYVSALQRYETVLAGTVAPPAARTAAAGALSLVRQDVPFLSTINGLPSLSLGTYLAQLDNKASELQLAFGEVESQLRAAQR
jgi:hypothetical protein